MLSSDQTNRIQELISIENYPSMDSLKDEIRTRIEKYEKSNCKFSELILRGSNILIFFMPKN